MELLIQNGWAFILGLISSAVFAYVKKRVEGLATLQDLRASIDTQEQVRSGYARALEDHRDDIWRDQQRLVVFREDYRQQFDIFSRSMKVLTNLIQVIDNIQLLQARREVFRGCGWYSQVPQEQKNYEDKYEEYRSLVILECDKYRALGVELGELKAACSVYFEHDFSPRLLAIEEKARRACEVHWSADEFDACLKALLSERVNFGEASSKVVKKYRDLCSEFVIDEQVNDFYRDLRSVVRATRDRALKGEHVALNLLNEKLGNESEFERQDSGLK